VTEKNYAGNLVFEFLEAEANAFLSLKAQLYTHGFFIDTCIDPFRKGSLALNWRLLPSHFQANTDTGASSRRRAQGENNKQTRILEHNCPQ
jgi:hypothetical protein